MVTIPARYEPPFAPSDSPQVMLRRMTEYARMESAAVNVRITASGSVVRRADSQSEAVFSETKEQYLGHLWRVFRTGQFVMLACSLVAWFFVYDLSSYFQGKGSLLYPLLSMIIVAAMLSLVVLAHFSMSRTAKQYRRTVREES